MWDLTKAFAGGVRPPVRQMDASILHKYDPVFRADHGGVRSMAFSADGAYD